jgi:hypothetical protein
MLYVLCLYVGHDQTLMYLLKKEDFLHIGHVVGNAVVIFILIEL